MEVRHDDDDDDDDDYANDNSNLSYTIHSTNRDRVWAKNWTID